MGEVGGEEANDEKQEGTDLLKAGATSRLETGQGKAVRGAHLVDRR